MSRSLSLLRTVLLAACSVPVVRGRRETSFVPVLMYHSIDESRSPMSVTPQLFRRQLDWLAARGYRALTISDVAAALPDGRFPDRSVAITFDDAYENVFRAGVPLLRERGFRATVFVPSAMVGKDNGWSGPRVPRMPIATWRDIEAAGCDGTLEIGAHSRTHPRLGRLSPEALRQEVEGSRDEIAARLGKPIRSFAYPYGNTNAAVVAAVAAAGFTAACTTCWGHVVSGESAFLLPRIPMYQEMFMSEFRASFSPSVERSRRLVGFLRRHQGRKSGRRRVVS